MATHLRVLWVGLVWVAASGVSFGEPLFEMPPMPPSVDLCPDPTAIDTPSLKLGKDQAHQGAVYHVAFSPDGKLLASAGNDRTIGLWDLTTGNELRRMTGHDDCVRWLVFSPDGKTLASASYDKTVRLWDTATGKEKAKLEGHEQPVLGLALSPDGKTLASASFDKSVILWNLATGKAVDKLIHHAEPLYAVSFSPDGKMLASGGNSVRFWDLQGKKECGRIDGFHEVCYCPFDADGSVVACGSEGSPLVLGDARRGKARSTLRGGASGAASGCFSPDGRTLAVGQQGTVSLLEASTWKERRQLWGHAGQVWTVAFSSDGSKMASGDESGQVFCWETRQPRNDNERSSADLWSDLRNDDARRAYESMLHLLRDETSTLALIAKHTQPVEFDEKEIGALIAGLDSDKFQVRDSAMRRLTELDAVVRPHLVSALDGTPSLEARRRLAALLENLDGDLSPLVRQHLRTIELLDNLARSKDAKVAKEARGTLDRLAKGNEKAVLTRASARIIQRLGRDK